MFDSEIQRYSVLSIFDYIKIQIECFLSFEKLQTGKEPWIIGLQILKHASMQQNAVHVAACGQIAWTCHYHASPLRGPASIPPFSCGKDVHPEAKLWSYYATAN